MDAAAVPASAAGIHLGGAHRGPIRRRAGLRIKAVAGHGKGPGGGLLADAVDTRKNQGVGDTALAQQGGQQIEGPLLAPYKMKTVHRSETRPALIAESSVDPLTQFFTGFEKREAFGFDQHPVAGFGVAAGVALVFLDEKAAKASNFDPLTAGHGVGHVIEENLNHLGRFGLGHIGFGFQGRYEFQFIHTTSFIMGSLRFRYNTVIIKQMQLKSQGVMRYHASRRPSPA
jgi:hypothetical protein